MAAFFTVLSMIGVLVGLFVLSQGMWGDGIGGPLSVAVGVFVTVKELLDMVFAK